MLFLPDRSGSNEKPIELIVKNKTDACRLDQFLTGAFPGYSRSLIQKAIETGAVTVNEVAAKASQKVRTEDRIRFMLPNVRCAEITPEEIPLQVLYEDDDLAVINKPADMVVHPAKGNWGGTLANALRFHFQTLSHLNGTYRPGIVHRLDRDTSGVILIAKNEGAHRKLSLQFEERKIFKEYLAITHGVLERDSDYIERAIGHHPRDRIKMTTFEEPDEEESIKDACTYYEVIERFAGYTFCRLHPKTGRTHQIRVHLAHIDCPVLADKIYSGRDCLRMSDVLAGRRNLEGESTEDETLLSRQALHAHRLRYIHPRHGEIMEAVAPLPAEFERTLAVLRKHRPVR